jgi:hypothetical protein
MKAKSIVYWVTTILVAVSIGSGAAATWAAVGGPGEAFHIIAPLIIAGFTVASWALRPESRKISVFSPATNGMTV